MRTLSLNEGQPLSQGTSLTHGLRRRSMPWGSLQRPGSPPKAICCLLHFYPPINNCKVWGINTVTSKVTVTPNEKQVSIWRSGTSATWCRWYHTPLDKCQINSGFMKGPGNAKKLIHLLRTMKTKKKSQIIIFTATLEQILKDNSDIKTLHIWKTYVLPLRYTRQVSFLRKW